MFPLVRIRYIQCLCCTVILQQQKKVVHSQVSIYRYKYLFIVTKSPQINNDLVFSIFDINTSDSWRVKFKEKAWEKQITTTILNSDDCGFHFSFMPWLGDDKYYVKIDLAAYFYMIRQHISTGPWLGCIYVCNVSRSPDLLQICTVFWYGSHHTSTPKSHVLIKNWLCTLSGISCRIKSKVWPSKNASGTHTAVIEKTITT